MSSRNRKLSLVALIGFGFFGTAANASPGIIDCIDHEHRYILRDFTPSGRGHLGSLTFIDTFDRMNVSLFCGFDPSQTNRIEIACVSSHLGSAETIIRARVHSQKDSNMPRIALVEVQKGTTSNATINEIVPLVCLSKESLLL